MFIFSKYVVKAQVTAGSLKTETGNRAHKPGGEGQSDSVLMEERVMEDLRPRLPRPGPCTGAVPWAAVSQQLSVKAGLSSPRASLATPTGGGAARLRPGAEPNAGPPGRQGATGACSALSRRWSRGLRMLRARRGHRAGSSSRARRAKGFMGRRWGLA